MSLNKSIKNINNSNGNSIHGININDNDISSRNNNDIKPNNKIKFIDSGIEYLKNVNLKGSLIVIEGPDASGRSTKSKKITAKLESDGHAVINAGLRNLPLYLKELSKPKRTL